MQKTLIQEKVKKLTKYTNNLCEIANNENIIVYEQDLGSGDGLYLYIQKTKVIILNNNLSYWKKQIVLAHEIGHAILHAKEKHAFSLSKTKTIQEKEANLFAVELLEQIGFWGNEDIEITNKEFSDSDLCFFLTLKADVTISIIDGVI